MDTSPKVQDSTMDDGDTVTLEAKQRNNCDADFSIPSGEKGPRGKHGPHGVQGPRGPIYYMPSPPDPVVLRGENGPHGEHGPQGPTYNIYSVFPFYPRVEDDPHEKDGIED